ncbi:MAG: hypothetical protein ACJ74D_08080 [Gaiellaceae bacterium]
MPRQKIDDAPPQAETREAPPGEFVSNEHEADCLRFLEQVKEFVQRRHEAGLGRGH